MGFDRADLFRQAGFGEGQIIPGYSARFTEGTTGFTSTSFTRLTGAASAVSFPFDQIVPDGVDASLGFTCALRTDTAGETARARLEVDFDPKPDTEVSVTATSPTFVTSALTDDLPTSSARVDIQGEVTSGQGTIEGNVTTALFYEL
jgi:hypothetical protein